MGLRNYLQLSVIPCPRWLRNLHGFRKYVIIAQVLGFDGDKILLSPSSSYIVERQNRKFLALLPDKADSGNGALMEVSENFKVSLSKGSKMMMCIVSGIVASRRNVEIVLVSEDGKLDSFEIESMRFIRD